MRVADRPSSSTVVLIFQTVTKLVNFDTKYKQIFQEAGMLHMLLALLKSFHGQFLASKGIPSDADGDRDEVGDVDDSPIATFTVTMDCITLLLDNMPENIRIFRESGCAPILFALLYHDDTRCVIEHSWFPTRNYCTYSPRCAGPLHCV